MRIGVAATPDVAIPTLDWLLGTEHQIALVITQPDKPAGRGRILSQTVVADWAVKHGIPLLKPLRTHELHGVVNELDLVLTIGYGVILPEEIINLPRYGFLNLHFSLLPAYRGAAPAQRALQRGEKISGVTVFQLDKGMDTGPIYSQVEIGIDPSWRAYELLQHLAHLGPEAVESAFQSIKDGKSPVPQDGAVSIAPKISKQEAFLDFTEGSESVVNSIRAFTYEPGAWTLWRGEPFKITAAVIAQLTDLPSAQIRSDEDGVFVGTGDTTAIQIITVIPAGKKEMAAIDWARGARLETGDHFG